MKLLRYQEQMWLKIQVISFSCVGSKRCLECLWEDFFFIYLFIFLGLFVILFVLGKSILLIVHVTY